MVKLKKTAKQAKVGDGQPTTAHHGSTASSKTHSFFRTIAKEYREKAAVLLEYLTHQVSKSYHPFWRRDEI
jgi:hypothetical protein